LEVRGELNAMVRAELYSQSEVHFAVIDPIGGRSILLDRVQTNCLVSALKMLYEIA